MAQTSVAQFATDLKMPATMLLEQLQMAGVVKSKADDLLTEQDKAMLELVGSELVKRAAERARRKEERLKAMKEGREEAEGEA